MGLLVGLDLTSLGSIEILCKSLSELDKEGRARLRAEQIGFVFQSFLLLPSMTALENVMLPAELSGERDCEPRALELLAAVGLGEEPDQGLQPLPAGATGSHPLRRHRGDRRGALLGLVAVTIMQ